jgi:hypothetical protein
MDDFDDLISELAIEDAMSCPESRRIFLYLDDVQLQYMDGSTGVGLRCELLGSMEKISNVKVEETAIAYRFYVPNPGRRLDLTGKWQVSIDAGITLVDAQFVEAVPNPGVPDEVVVTVQVV